MVASYSILLAGLAFDALVLTGVLLGERVLGELVARRIEQQALGFYPPVFLLGRARVAPPHVLRLYSLAIEVEREQRCTQLAARALDHETGCCMCAFDRREKVNEAHAAMLEDLAPRAAGVVEPAASASRRSLWQAGD